MMNAHQSTLNSDILRFARSFAARTGSPPSARDVAVSVDLRQRSAYEKIVALRAQGKWPLCDWEREERTHRR
jgi:hypothetical protein